MHAINSTYVTARYRSVHLITAMLFLSLSMEIALISKGNLILELIANMFLILNKDIKKIQYATSELCEYMLDNIS